MTNASKSLSMKKYEVEFLSAVKEGVTIAVAQFIRNYPEKWKEVTNLDGETALHLAPNADVAECLILHGANMEALNKRGFTPFLCAVLYGRSEVMNVLIRRGCSIVAKTNDGNGALALSSLNGHFEISRQLVGLKFDVNETHQKGSTSLHLASREGHAQMADFLISSGADKEFLDEFGLTPFFGAVICGHFEVIDVLIRRGCNIFAIAHDGSGALAAASRYGHLDIARKLLRMGLSVNKRDQNGFTSLHWACNEGNAQTAEFLISSGAEIDALDKLGATPFLHAVSEGHSQVITVLFQSGCNLSAKTNNGIGALALSSQCGNLDIARQLVGMGLSVNDSHQKGTTSLHWACQNGHAQTADFLISSGADIEALDQWEETPFLLAVCKGHSDVMNVLYQRGCDISAKTSGGTGALALSSQNGHLDIARQLVQMGLSVHDSNEEGATSLLWACQKGHVETALFLISAGADVEALDVLGTTPFLQAVMNGHVQVMDVLIRHGCNTSAKDSNGNGPLALASQKGHLNTLRRLIGMGFKVDEHHQNGFSALHWACHEGHAQTAEFLTSSGARIEALDKEGGTPFLRAVLKGHSEVINILFRRSCDISVKNNAGNGALAIACGAGLLNIAKLLLRIGCRVNEHHQNGYTALHWACHNGHAQTAEFLISCGANIEAKNKYGRTPLLEADFTKQYDVVDAIVRILGSQISIEHSSEKKQPKSGDGSETYDRSQEIYDEALKRGSVRVNRSRVIIAGQDGAGKSCLFDSLLNRQFERNKPSTEGAAVAMIHTATSGWIATDSKDHLDPLIAQGVYRMNQQQLSSKRGPETSLESSDFALQSKDSDSESEVAELDDSEHHDICSTPIRDSTDMSFVQPAPEAETLAGNLKAVGIDSKALTASQQQLVHTFFTNRPSEEDLSRQLLGVRDIWDLGGQEVYLATHSAFMPDHKVFGLSMYMIVMDISKLLSDEAESFHRSSDGEVINQTNELGWIRTNGDFPLYWFGSITAAHEQTPVGDHWLGKDEEVVSPPVFAIGSHRDVLDSDKERFTDSVSVRNWLRKQGKLFERLLSDSDFMKHIVVPKKHGVREDDEDFCEITHFFNRIFLIDNTLSGSGSPCKGVKEIRERVDRMTMTYWKGMKKQPLYWVYLEILLFRWSKFMKTVVAEVDEIAKLAQHPTICNLSSRDEVLVALKYLANVGAILYYPEVDGLKDVVLTRPMWVVKALSAFVTAAEPGPYMMPEWRNLKDKGIMSNDLMKYRLEQIRNFFSSDFATDLNVTDPEHVENDNRLIVRLLELLDVIAPVAGSPRKAFYVPSMLKTAFLYSPTHWENHNHSSAFPTSLVIIPMKLKFIPECIYFRLVTRFLNLYPKNPELSRHQCIFLIQDQNSPVEVEVELLYHKRGSWIALTIRYINEDDFGKASPLFLQSIKEHLCKQMKNVCQQGMEGFKYSTCSQIEEAVRADGHLNIDVKSLPVLQREELEYFPSNPKLYNIFGKRLRVQADDLFRINCWFGHQLGDDTPTSKDALNEVISPSVIRVVSALVEAKWQRFAVCLGRKSSFILQCKEKSDENLLRSMMAIEDWVAESGREATAGTLFQACEECGIHRDNIIAALEEKSLSRLGQCLASLNPTKRSGLVKLALDDPVQVSTRSMIGLCKEYSYIVAAVTIAVAAAVVFVVVERL
ncbi:uncharacterized protein [Oscarella lobularis]|uniref:uncharacterized protein isoform X2 n=1 Tax=Oscarella lobularis TaxID=121494 RepID=UPI003313B657